MGSTGKAVKETESPYNTKLSELQKELSEAKGLFAKAKIKSQIEMLEAGFTGTVEEWNARKAEERARRAAEAEARIAAEKAEKQAKADAIQKNLEYEMKTQPTEKVEQFKIIQEFNPMRDEYHLGIRKPSDIRTWQEVVNVKNDAEEGQFAWGDFSRADAEKALTTGKITVYSSYPIKQGVFVSTSKIQAEQYAGGVGNKIYSKTIPLSDVAWINGDEGQFAKTKKR